MQQRCQSIPTHRAVSFPGEPSEAVHYALHYLGGQVVVTDPHPPPEKNGLVALEGELSEEIVITPLLELPEMFSLLQLANQVSPMLALEGVVGESVV